MGKKILDKSKVSDRDLGFWDWKTEKCNEDSKNKDT